jgi:type I restriction enzyme M protein
MSEGPQESFFSEVGTVSELIPAGKLKCFITGNHRNDTPEERVRQATARSLVEEYGYKPANIAVEFTIPMGRRRPRADLVIFPSGAVRRAENAILIVETKKESVKPTNRDNGIDQLHSYILASGAAWGMWVGSEVRAFRRGGEEQEVFVEEPDIPPAGKKRPPRLRVDQLTPAEGLKPQFRRIHNYIYANEGLPKDAAFHELLKLIFTKVYDEETSSGELGFDVDENERLSPLGQRRLRERLGRLFEGVKERFPYIFDSDGTLRLSDRVLAYVVTELRRYSLIETRTDIKGEAYQELVRDNLRGDRGEFFTPDNVCRMAARMTLELFDKDKRLDLKVLDPACGTGGFLRAMLNEFQNMIMERELVVAPHGTVVEG